MHTIVIGSNSWINLKIKRCDLHTLDYFLIFAPDYGFQVRENKISNQFYTYRYGRKKNIYDA